MQGVPSEIFPQLGKETVLEAKGRRWTVGRFEADVWDDLLAWAKGRLPDPWAGLDRLAALVEKLPGDHPAWDHYWEEFRAARDKSQVVYGIESPEITRLIDGTVEGQLRRLWLLLRKSHPEVTLTDALEIVVEVGPKLVAASVGKANGTPPAVPNAPAPAA